MGGSVADAARFGTAPLLRWPGGKRWFVDRYSEVFDRSYRNYIEPFVGGGSVFFDLAPSSALLIDANRELITTYSAVRDNPDKVEKKLLRYLSSHSHDAFYAIRAESPNNRFDVAARMLYLNKTCFNGIYRVNQMGKFNVPIGDRRGQRYRRGDLAKAAKLLSVAELIQGDFTVAADSIGRGDLVYLDPPYTVNRKSDSFIRYNDKLFSWTDQLRLATFAEEVVERGATVIVTNAYYPALVDRYLESNLFDIRPLTRYSSISADSSKRSLLTELLITSKGIVDEFTWGLL